MSGRPVGGPGPSGLDRTPFNPTPSPISFTAAPSTSHCLPPSGSDSVQHRSPSGQDGAHHKAALERAFAKVDLSPAPVPYQSAAGYPALHVPKRSRSPPKEGAPPFQYKAASRPEGYHLASYGPGLSPNLPIAASFSREANSSGQSVQQLVPCRISPLISTEGPSVEPLSKARVAPPRPPRSPTYYDFDEIAPPNLRSTSAPFVNRFGEQAIDSPFESPPPLSASQASTAKPLRFNTAESPRSPQLVSPYQSGGYNPFKNPFNPKAKSSQPKPIKKTTIWERAFRKFSDRQVSTYHSARAAISRSPSPSAPLLRPRAPTPNRGRAFTQPQANFSNQYFTKTLGCKSSEDNLLQNKVTEIKTLFSVTHDGTFILNADPADNYWEVEALRKNKVRSKRVFTCPDFVFEHPGEHRAPSDQYQSKPQGFAETLASQPANPRDSQDSLRTLAAQPEGLGISQDFVRPFSWQLQNQRNSRDSASTLVDTPQDTIIYRDPEGRYYSLSPRHQRHPQGVEAAQGAEGAEETGHWVEIPISTLGKSESSPVPNEFFEDKCEEVDSQNTSPQESEFNRERDSPRLAGEVDLSKSYPESVVAVQSPRNQVHRKVRAVSNRQLIPSTPKSDGYRQAYWALTGGRPTDSVCQYWTPKSRDWSPGEEPGDFDNPKSKENVDDCCSSSPTEHFEERSPSRGRGRVRESQSIPEEDIPREESCSIAKRKIIAQRRKLDRIRRQERVTAPCEQEGPSEGVVDRFLAERREVVNPRIKPQQTLSAAKCGADRQKRLAAAPDEVGASAPKGYFDIVFESNKPLKQNLGEDTHRVDCQSYCGEAFDGDLVAISDCAPHISERTVKRLTNRAQEYSSQLRDEDLLVCIRSKTGTVKELPVTPENKAKIKTVLQQEAGYTPSVYSGDDKEIAPSTVADLCVTPLAFKKKSPTTPRSEESLHQFPSPSQADPFRTTRAFLDSCLSVPEDHPHATMDTLQVSSALRSSTKTKAEEDARAMQKSVIESCKKAGRDPPKYVLMELIGKGSFGRVYKGKDINTTQIVAVKIIDIDESDTLNPRLADTYSEFMKEVNALKILSESKAKNINHVIEALPVGTAMWMITEYCGGGSIATLMKPTPDGLKEKFIIPILREVAEAVKWVHQAGIIHRDLKCANILITEEGGVQLCDFGVAGITETALDKRSTFIGTFHWMAPELFRGSSYGKEVDIWAFGSMTYEMATGLPPNAMSGVSGMDLGAYLKTHIPRLEGDNYSEGLKSIVAYCLEENPSDRPTIEAVQKHGYIYNTNAKYPSSGLSDLVKAFKLWESHGGTRKSLFAIGGAQGPSELSSTALSDDNWNFSTTPAFDQAVAQAANPQDIINVYGASVALSTDFADETSRPNRQQQTRPSRRRPPPEALAPLKAPLEKLFDPNTMSNYRDNSIQHFNLQPNNASDLPLRDDSAQISIRDTLIDLDAHDIPSGLSSFSEMDTMKPARRAVQDAYEEDYESGSSLDYSRPALSDPVDNPNRRTQDWKFPSMAPPASANPEFTRFPPLQRPNVTPASGARPALVHHPTEPVSLPSQSFQSLAPPAPASDRMSLIDLDMSIPEPSRPSTADSSASQDNASANPFMWERHASMYNAQGHRSAREPSLYLDDSSSGLQMRSGNTLRDMVEVSDFSASDAEGYPDEQYDGYRTRHEDQPHEPYSVQSAAGNMQGDYDSNNITNRTRWNGLNSSSASHSAALFHPLPPPPSAAVLSGTASHAEMHAESHRMFNTLRLSLETFRETYENMPTRPPKNNQSTPGDDTRGVSSMHDTGSNIS